MTLYRGQKTKYNNGVFGPALLRENAVEKIEDIKAYIMCRTGKTDLDQYKSELADCYFPKLPFPSLHKELAIVDHLYYFFLSLINAWLKIQENEAFTGICSKHSGFFQQVIRTNTNKRKIENYTLSDPQGVCKFFEILLKTDGMFDGDYLNVYSFFQHLNFVSPGSYPTLLFDWTSDINVAALFSIGKSGEIGTVVSMKYPNELYRCFDACSGTAFFNTFGYACVHGDAGLNYQHFPPYTLFENLLMRVQKATCLYWPYKLTLKELDTEKYKDVLGFHILTKDEVEQKLQSSDNLSG